MHMTTKALVLRQVDYKESDKILTLLTQEAGRLTASARGCRRKGSPIAAGSQLLVWSDVVLHEYRGRWTVQEAAVDREFRGMREDLEKFSLGCYFAEVTELLAVEGLPCPELLAVQEQLASALRAAGFPLEGRPFTPHLTLGREVLLHPGFRLDTFSQTLPDLRIPVKRLCLMESRRDGGKLVYREISAVELPAKG